MFINFEKIAKKLFSKILEIKFLKLLTSRMLPLIVSWASSEHILQVCTVEYAVSRLFAARRLGRSLDGIWIELDCSMYTGKVPCNGEALNEMIRLREHEWTNFRWIVAYDILKVKSPE